jgi:dolichol-phosphate mannosyltransferase
VNWPKHREILSRAANIYSRIALGGKVTEYTAGFRAYRRAVLEKLPLGEIASRGYCFQIDLAWRTVQAGFEVVQVPITFTEREIGESKMSGSVIREAMVRVGIWGAQHRWQQLRRLAGR